MPDRATLIATAAPGCWLSATSSLDGPRQAEVAQVVAAPEPAPCSSRTWRYSPGAPASAGAPGEYRQVLDEQGAGSGAATTWATSAWRGPSRLEVADSQHPGAAVAIKVARSGMVGELPPPPADPEPR